MNENQLENILLSTLHSSNEIRIQAENSIEIMRNNLQEYFTNIYDLLSTTSNQVAFNMGLALILHEIRSDNFWANRRNDTIIFKFLELIKQFIILRKINEETLPSCNIVNIILQGFYQKSQFSVKNHIIDFLLIFCQEFPHLLHVFVDCLSNIFLECDCYLPLNHFLSLFSSPITSSHDFTSKFKLLISFARTFFSNKNIHLCNNELGINIDTLNEIFLNYFNNIPADCLNSILSFFSENLQKISRLVEIHLQTFFQFFSKCFSINDETTRALTTDCLVSIVTTFPNSDDIVLFSLSEIMKIIEMDENFLQLGRNGISLISQNASPFLFLNKLENIHKTNNFHYSYLIALAEIDSNLSIYMIEHTTQYFMEIQTLVNEGVFRNKFASFLAIINLCNILAPSFQEDNFNGLFGILSNHLYQETNFELLILILEGLTGFLNCVSINENSQSISMLFEFLMNLLLKCKNVVIQSTIIKVMNSFVQALSQSFLLYFPSLLKILFQLVETNRLDLTISIIRLCDIVVTHLGKFIQSREELLPLFHISLELRNKVENESYIEYISHAIISFIHFFDDTISNDVIQIIPVYFGIASKEIEITHFPDNHQIEYIPGFVRASTNDFVKRSTIREISFALMTINTIISLLKRNYQQFVPVTIEIVSKWIRYPILINEVRYPSWLILNKLMLFCDINADIVPILFIENSINLLLMDKIIPFIKNAIQIGMVRNSLKIDCFIKILEIVLQSLQNKINSAECAIITETNFIKFGLKNIPQVTSSFFNNIIKPVIPELIQHENGLEFVLKVAPTYIIISHDNSFLGDLIFIMNESLNDIESSNAQIAMKAIGKLCKENLYSQDFYLLEYEKMVSILNNKNSFENDSLILLNETIISFTKLIQSHHDLFDMNISIKLLFDSVGMLISHKKSQIVNDFIATLLVNKTSEVLEVIGVSSLIKIVLSQINRESVSQKSNEIFKQFLIQFFTKGNPVPQELGLTEREVNKLQSILGNQQ
ncbi:hypothetical protein TRFO_40878 [Tritrichomonas foetus]|uniref:Importin N-terminal domain-containing protein n=1 Tax=Tritrichomonas foetus TaxID=1144522 RepID=A0A1J4J5S8_9EUKA|nr:hypothetical protein TRFO_40878 [Tritrichomonas foetus]|eukprot:OHS92813.1 hypothetical protein TRFO_40878 [Tritrichomonas foetus]